VVVRPRRIGEAVEAVIVARATEVTRPPPIASLGLARLRPRTIFIS
jgi:hypothetical protein